MRASGSDGQSPIDILNILYTERGRSNSPETLSKIIYTRTTKSPSEGADTETQRGEYTDLHADVAAAAVLPTAPPEVVAGPAPDGRLQGQGGKVSG